MVLRGIRFIPAERNINFIGMRWVAFVFSSLLMAASIFMLVGKGLNMGVDFTGGTVIEIRTPVIPNLEEMRVQLNGLGLGSVSIQEFGKPDDLLIRMSEQIAPEGWVSTDGKGYNSFSIVTVQSKINEIFKDGEVDYRRIEFVGPQVGSELKLKGLYAVLFSLIGIMTYIWFRFEWQFGVAAIVALAHDALATLGLFALTQMEFNLSTVAAILMIAGYSINDTVVVFDRIREDLRKYKKKPLSEVFNMSINQTLYRTLMTSMTTLLALISLYVFGGEVIRGFVDALIFGILVGTYSSIFVASPVLLTMNLNRGAVREEVSAKS
ncbi:MAG: protein translocase subunit SecF [Alphaproteobacteria bacterium]|nr:protein translocase subunit SecF [Alphaproteobacteria bacterium]